MMPFGFRSAFRWFPAVAALALVAAAAAPAAASLPLQPCSTRCKASTHCLMPCLGHNGSNINCGEWGVCSGPFYDLVEWMLPSYPNHQNTHLIQTAPGNNGVRSEFFTCPAFPNGFFRVSDTCGKLHERFVFDQQNIYITRETFPDAPILFKTHGSFVWARRSMFSGESFVTDCSWRLHTSCAVPPLQSCQMTVRLEGPVTLSLGGNVGTVQALVVEHVVGNGIERYFYAKPWGYVKFEFRTLSGTLLLNEEFNTLAAGNLMPKTSPCYGLECGGQIGCP